MSEMIYIIHITLYIRIDAIRKQRLQEPTFEKNPFAQDLCSETLLWSGTLFLVLRNAIFRALERNFSCSCNFDVVQRYIIIIFEKIINAKCGPQKSLTKFFGYMPKPTFLFAYLQVDYRIIF